ncbi:hypothetical protein SCG7086_AB_00400 [Chlamydiales bacterium SCGC AG-110-P3]|nr:hypothetical protein SCG7086_AB_00400 [Chlamydiales bacterium SCGC AG-110-P3]
MVKLRDDASKKSIHASALLTGLHLGDVTLTFDEFDDLDNVFAKFHTEEFRNLSLRKRFKRINHTLVRLIQNAPEPAFLLGAVTRYLARVNSEHLLPELYNFEKFEFWLNQFSKLNRADNYRIRAKIVGKYIPRDDYQCFFPIGMDKTYSGSHFVAAHLSPDIDTTIASFWGWIDAMGACVSEGLHLWYLPGGAPSSHFKLFFQSLFGDTAFQLLSRHEGGLTLTAQDLVTKRGMARKPAHTQTSALDHRVDGKAIVLVDDKGHCLGDWRSSDVEGARQVVMDFNACLRWFENGLHVKLISLFAKESLSTKDLPQLTKDIFGTLICRCEPAKDFSERQRHHLNDYLEAVIGVKKGLNATFAELTQALTTLSIEEFAQLENYIKSLSDSSIFDSKGTLIENRPQIFHKLEKIIKAVDEAIVRARNYVDRLDMMIAIKHNVLHRPQNFLSLSDDVEEIRRKLGDHHYATVVIPEEKNQLFPVGIVDAEDLRRPALGTVTLRDFCNEDETHMAPYLQVISVIDHHKATLSTTAPPLAIIGDAQSCNVLIAEQTFRINDQYSLGNMSASTIKIALKNHAKRKDGGKRQFRLHQRTLHRQIALEDSHDHYIHPLREYTEYLCFLYAILDDTDLLSKVTKRDILCLGEILNRLKSLSVGEDVEIVDFDDLPRDEHFSRKAAQRILQNEDMYSLYKKIYSYREGSVESDLIAVGNGGGEPVFADTKEQNGCSRIGQTKIFASNYATFQKEKSKIRQKWLEHAIAASRTNTSLDIHIHMISTITGAEEVYHGNGGKYTHPDEMWIWTADTPTADEHLTKFLASFRQSREIAHNKVSVKLCGPNATLLKQLFDEHFAGIKVTIDKDADQGLPIAILHYTAASINSRKSMITPHIPRVII